MSTDIRGETASLPNAPMLHVAGLRSRAEVLDFQLRLRLSVSKCLEGALRGARFCQGEDSNLLLCILFGNEEQKRYPLVDGGNQSTILNSTYH